MLLFLISCSDPEDKTTHELNAYLERFSVRLNDSSVYCFIPDNQCQNCFRFNGKNMAPETRKHLVIISSFPASNFEGFENVYHDSTDDMLQLPSLNYGNRFIRFQNGRSSIIPLTDLYVQADSLTSELPCLKHRNR
ncbi:MAG: hypothetical protein JST26_03945 [Bacteroidetes bacterium]|nr:hypothetical protein [Bacteroidota bacterium]